ALKHPELVRSLTLYDSHVHFKGDKFGEVALPTIQAARAAYEKGKTAEALEALLEVPAGQKVKLAEMPEDVRKRLMRRAGELEAGRGGGARGGGEGRLFPRGGWGGRPEIRGAGAADERRKNPADLRVDQGRNDARASRKEPEAGHPPRREPQSPLYPCRAVS